MIRSGHHYFIRSAAQIHERDKAPDQGETDAPGRTGEKPLQKHRESRRAFPREGGRRAKEREHCILIFQGTLNSVIQNSFMNLAREEMRLAPD